MHNAPQEEGSREDARKAFTVCAVAGGGFGLVAGAIFLFLGVAPHNQPVLFLAALSLFTAVISGLGGLGGTYLNGVLLRLGISNPFGRMLLTFVIICAIPIGAAMLFIVRGFDPDLRRYSLLGVFLGLVFGSLVAFINYRLWTVQQRVIALEMENRYLAELAGKNRLLQEAARNLAVAEERNRMARELHDSISQGMHGIVYSLHSLRHLLGSGGREGEILDHLEETTQLTLQELRRMIMELKPSPLEDHGLERALRWHCEIFARRQEVELDQRLKYHGGLSPEQEVALYRILQEALANIQKHAGASLVNVSLEENETQVTMTVRDNGQGFDLSTVKKGNGLENMTARARQNGGSLHLQPSLGEGTCLEVVFPLPH
jgi:signal transduction histidine kinase